MEKDYEQDYLAVEKTHPWFVKRRELIVSLLGAKCKLADVGCGSGLLLETLHSKGWKDLWGFEYSETMQKQGNYKLISADATKLPSKSSTFDAVTCLDVIEHIDDDKLAVSELARILKPNGKCIITVPAFMFLWGPHDTVNQHKRRYTKSTLMEVVKPYFDVEFATYWNSLAFIPTALMKLIRKASSSPKSDASIMPKPLMAIYSAVITFENWLINHGMRMPVGTSVVAVLRKK